MPTCASVGQTSERVVMRRPAPVLQQRAFGHRTDSTARRNTFRDEADEPSRDSVIVPIAREERVTIGAYGNSWSTRRTARRLSHLLHSTGKITEFHAFHQINSFSVELTFLRCNFANLVSRSTRSSRLSCVATLSPTHLPGRADHAPWMLRAHFVSASQQLPFQ